MPYISPRAAPLRQQICWRFISAHCKTTRSFAKRKQPGSLPVYDARFERSLRVGRRLFAVVGEAPVMDAILVRRVDTAEWIRESLFETVIEPLINATAAQRFVF